MPYIIRPMKVEDIPEVMEIDREAFPTQWPPFSYNSYKRELQNRLAYYIVAHREIENNPEFPPSSGNKETKSPWLKKVIHRFINSSRIVLEGTGQYIAGFAGFWVMFDEAHLTTIAVREVLRRRGIGESLLISIIELATKLNVKVVTLEVRKSNRPAQALYEKYGFQTVGIRPGYYSDNKEDALLMSTENITTASFKEHFRQLKEAHTKKWGKTFIRLLEEPRDRN